MCQVVAVAQVAQVAMVQEPVVLVLVAQAVQD
jgi:hypothetical protein